MPPPVTDPLLRGAWLLANVVEELRRLGLVVLAVLAVAAWAWPAPASPGSGPVYFARVDYVLSVKSNVSLLLGEDQVKEIAAPPSPPGYRLYYMRVSFASGLPAGVALLKFDRKVEVGGKVVSLVSYDGVVKLAALAPNATVEAVVTTYYVKSRWLQLRDGEIELQVEEPPPPFTKDDLTVRISIDNHAPYKVVDVKGPGGESLLGSEYSPDAIRVDPKHVELSFKYFEPSSYRIVVAEGEDYILPSSFLLVETAFHNDTLRPGEVRRYAVPEKLGWKSLGALVVLYSVAPLSGKSGGSAEVVGELVDYAYMKDESVRIRAASLLVPDLNLRVWVRAYIVFGGWFEVRNGMRAALNVMYTPILIREAGAWEPDGVEVTVRESDVRDACAAYIVVQAPSYGRIAGIVTPSGDEVGGLSEGVLPWGGEYRSVRVFENEAYVQVKAFNVVEPGRYFVKIDWQPVAFKLVDDEGRPVAGAIVEVHGPLNATALSDRGGVASFKLYKPGPYSVEVKFKGVTVAAVTLGSIVSTEVPLKCRVYRVSWLVTDAWDKPLEGVEIVVRSGDALIARAVSGEGGVAEVDQIPGGTFTIQMTYKRVSAVDVEEINASGVRKAKLDVFLEIPVLGGVPLTTLETLAATSLMGGCTLGLALVRRRKASSVEEISLEE